MHNEYIKLVTMYVFFHDYEHNKTETYEYKSWCKQLRNIT